MATRKETQTRRVALQSELRSACSDGTWTRGVPLPSVRQLASRYNVSHRIVNEALQGLMREGLLYSVPRQGTFVGSPVAPREGLFLFVTKTETRTDEQLGRMQFGFEDEISRLGGSCLTITADVLQRMLALEAPMEISGVVFSEMGDETSEAMWALPCAKVCLTSLAGAEQARMEQAAGAARMADYLYFDNVAAAHQMTRYLVAQGHSAIAFLGLHGQEDTDGVLDWSQERAAGWARALQENGTAARHLFTPRSLGGRVPEITRQIELATSVSAGLVDAVEQGQVTAVIAVNLHAARGLFQALSERGVAAAKWPVVTTFGLGDANDALMTSMLLPWEQMGREAASLLWARVRRNDVAPPRQVPVPMRLITRLSCAPAWRTRPEAALFQVLKIA